MNKIFSYVSSFFISSDDDLSLDDAYSILEANEDSKEGENPKKLTKESPNESLSKTGYITEISGNLYIIDDKYKFSSEEHFLSDLKDICVGSKVHFNVFYSDGIVKVTNVNLIESDWDVAGDVASKSSWNCRTIVAKVVGRKGRILQLDHGINLNLDTQSVEFLPVIGDWVQLDVKAEIDENVTDLSGAILEITNVSPLRQQIRAGKITSWDPVEKCGIINRSIFFNDLSCLSGYLPSVGDAVITEIIESDHKGLAWRALKIIPEYLKPSTENRRIQIDFLTSHPNIEVDDVYLSFSKLNEYKSFSIVVRNKTKESYKFSCKFTKLNSQCEITLDKEFVELDPLSETSISCECTSKSMGNSKEFFLLTFPDFKLGKFINISVSSNSNYSNNINTNRYKANKIANLLDQDCNNVVKGQKIAANVRFIAKRLPDFPVPQRIKDLFTVDYNDLELNEKLRAVKPSIFSNLSFHNYEDKFHNLLYLDEISILLEMQRKYNRDRVTFIQNNEFLMLEYENLAESRPSLAMGDRIFAKDFIGNKSEFEGYVHSVSAKYVYLKFAKMFHESYKGEDYSVRVVNGRGGIRRLHQGVHFAVRNLGKDFLFPSKIEEKEPLVSLNPPKTPPKNNRVSLVETLQRIKEFNKTRIKWFNPDLNSYQREAVKNVLQGKARPLPYIIFGPPGTGKTVTIVETILQIVKYFPECRLLVAAPSNSAADLIALKLIDNGLKPGELVRFVSNNYIMSDLIVPRLAPYCVTGTNARPGTELETQTLSNGLTIGCSSSVLGRHKITVSTCNSAGYLYTMGFPKGHFSHIIVDEAGQASEPEVMIPLAFLDVSSGQAILAGDPLQLGPVVLNSISKGSGLQESFLERLTNRFPYVQDPDGFPRTGGYDPRLVTKLRYNYRSLPTLLKLTSQLFYHDDLIATLDEQSDFLDQFKEALPRRKDGKTPAIVFHAVYGENCQTFDSPSWFNPHEADQVFFYVNELYRLGAKAGDIGIISPYIKQVREIKSLFTEAEFEIPRIGTVEEFQGQEFNIVIVSTVRSEEVYVQRDVQYSLGFVASSRRLNVAISRAKKLLIIIGNPNILTQDSHWKSVIQYCMENGSYMANEDYF